MTAAALDLDRPQAVHVVAIGGTAMNAIAGILHQLGHRVSGSDLRESPAVDRLRALGIPVAVPHDAAAVPDDVEVVLRSTAVPDTNVEVAVALHRGVPVLRRADALAALVAARPTVAVAGTHGKTTTSTMLTLALQGAGREPAYLIGAEVPQLGAPSGWPPGDGWFVTEADESDGTFLELPAQAAIVTSVEPDHLGHYGTFEALVDAFGRFLSQAPGPRVACADDAEAAVLAARAGAFTYGTAADARLRLVDVRPGPASVAARLELDGASAGELRVPVAGLHNLRNAAAAVAMAHLLGVDPATAAGAVAAYRGVRRRFEHRGEAGGVTFIDDYAHLPTEVRAAVAAARDGGWRRIVCVFQPHRYTRTLDHHRDFAGAFDGVDELVVTDIYTADEPHRPGVTGQLVADAVAAAPGAPPVHYVARAADLPDAVDALLGEGTLCLTLGAGDLTTRLPDQLLERRR